MLRNFGTKRNSHSLFCRSGGDRGADVETLRGTHGPDFEGRAIIHRGEAGGSCGCFGGKSDSSEKLLLIKGPFCFVFGSERDPAPKYAISLAHLKAITKDHQGGRSLVNLETALGEIEYELSFENANIAKSFKEAATQQAALGEAEEVRKVCLCRVFYFRKNSIFAVSTSTIHKSALVTSTFSTSDLLLNSRNLWL